jgi:hypothetical protein
MQPLRALFPAAAPTGVSIHPVRILRTVHRQKGETMEQTTLELAFRRALERRNASGRDRAKACWRVLADPAFHTGPPQSGEDPDEGVTGTGMTV